MNLYPNVFLIIALLLIGCSKDSDKDPSYLAANGVTITCDDSGMVGDTFKVDGITYTIVDETLGNRGADVTTVCTTRVTDMSEMFIGSQFNQDISSWEVINLREMSSMFKDSEFNQDLSGWNVVNVIDCNEFGIDTPQWILPKPNFTNCDPN